MLSVQNKKKGEGQFLNAKQMPLMNPAKFCL